MLFRSEENRYHLPNTYLRSRDDLLFEGKHPIWWKAGNRNYEIEGSGLSYDVTETKNKFLLSTRSSVFGTEERLSYFPKPKPPSIEKKSQRPNSAPAPVSLGGKSSPGHWLYGIQRSTKRYLKGGNETPGPNSYFLNFNSTRKKCPSCTFGRSSRFPTSIRDRRQFISQIDKNLR